MFIIFSHCNANRMWVYCEVEVTKLLTFVSSVVPCSSFLLYFIFILGYSIIQIFYKKRFIINKYLNNDNVEDIHLQYTNKSPKKFTLTSSDIGGDCGVRTGLNERRRIRPLLRRRRLDINGPGLRPILRWMQVIKLNRFPGRSVVVVVGRARRCFVRRCCGGLRPRARGALGGGWSTVQTGTTRAGEVDGDGLGTVTYIGHL